MSSNRTNKMFSLLPPYPLYDTNTRVVVISDSQYREYKQKQAREEIDVLMRKRDRYLAQVSELDNQIESLEKQAALTADKSAFVSEGFKDSVQSESFE